MNLISRGRLVLPSTNSPMNPPFLYADPPTRLMDPRFLWKLHKAWLSIFVRTCIRPLLLNSPAVPRSACFPCKPRLFLDPHFLLRCSALFIILVQLENRSRLSAVQLSIIQHVIVAFCQQCDVTWKPTGGFGRARQL